MIDDDCSGRIYVTTDIVIDMKTQRALSTKSIFLVDKDNNLIQAASLDVSDARYWHEPANEREYLRSPQRALWRTAKELKWDQYIQLDMFEWVTLSSVDQGKYKIYNTLWASKSSSVKAWCSRS